MALHRAEGYWSLGIDFLASGNYIAVNRTLIKAFGLEGAVLIGELASEAKYWNDRDKLEDGWFFSTIENVEEATGLSGYQQRKALSELTKAGIVETTQKGIPKKRYIRIHFMELVNLVNDKSLKNFTTVGEETSPLEREKVDVNNYNEQPEETTRKKERKKPSTFDAIIAERTNNPELAETIGEFIRMRSRIKKPLTNYALQMRLNKLWRLGKTDEERIAIARQSICACWQDFYPLKDDSRPTSRRSQYTEQQNAEFDEYAWNPDQIERI